MWWSLDCGRPSGSISIDSAFLSISKYHWIEKNEAI